MKIKRAESPTFISVGQRPTKQGIKGNEPCKGDIHLIAPLQGLEFLLHPYVGRCPTLMNVALSGLTIV